MSEIIPNEMPAGRELDHAVALAIFGTDAPHAIMSEWNLPPFSTDIEAAWAIIAELVTRGSYVQIEQRPAAWSARFWPIRLVWSLGETAPLAICRAALLVVSI